MKISVLMPVYNGEKYLRESMESILNQTFRDFEFLIINDGSTDGSADLIRSYHDSRIIFINNSENRGLITVLNQGLDVAKGQYVARMDQDDISRLNRLEKQVDFMDKHPDCGLCGSWIEVFGDVHCREIYKKATSHEEIGAQMLFVNPIAHPTVMIRRAVLEEYNLRYDLDFDHAEDYEFWSRLIGCCKFYNIPEVLLDYRISKSQITRKYQDEQNKKVMLIREKLLAVFRTDFTSNDLFVHRNLGTYDSPPTLEFIEQADDWLEKIRKVNQEKEIFPDIYLARAAGIVYYDLQKKNINLGPVILKKLLFSKTSNCISLRNKVRFIKFYLKKFIYLKVNRIKREFDIIAKNINSSEFEVDNWLISDFVIMKLVPIVGIRPFPLSELSLLASAVCYFRPTHIFEWGTHIGKSARVFYETAKYFNIQTEVHSIDLPDDVNHIEHPGERRGKLVLGLDNVILHQGDGLDTSLAIIKALPTDSRIIFYIDGDHSYDSVKRELSGIVASVPNAAILLHDTFYQSEASGYNIGPYKAVREILDREGNDYKSIRLDTGLPGMTLLYKNNNENFAHS